MTALLYLTCIEVVLEEQKPGDTRHAKREHIAMVLHAYHAGWHHLHTSEY